ncbi:MAG: ParB/RepB/Spo0J family partition protein [Lachnospiraceae bacterium]|nr:ParB/RepB/Spo0J family partition protein [Lachnospiraceae bacterium]
MAIKKGLGRGLDMLIPKEESTKSAETKENKAEKTEKKKENEEILLDIRQIEPNRNQPRKQFDEDAIEELAESIKMYGVIQPLIVQKKDDYYEIIAGERRWRACKKAGVKKVPVLIRNYEEQEILKISLIENLQREDLNPIEEAQAYQQLQEEYGLKQDEIAASVSKSRTAITNTMRLLKLDERVQKMILDNLITSGHGRTLIPLEDGDVQYQVAEKIMDENLSVREAEKLVKKILEPKEKEEEENNPEQEKMFEFFEEKMKHILGSKVTIKNNKKNKGKIEIEYYSQDELERLIDLIQSIKNE